MLRRITPTSVALARRLIASPSTTRSITSSTRSLNKAQDNFTKVLREEIDSIKAAGTYKSERVIVSPQNSSIRVAGKDGKTSAQINFCANNYLGKEMRKPKKKKKWQKLSSQSMVLTKQVANTMLDYVIGLADHPEVIARSKKFLDTHGSGLSSVRFICGTQVNTAGTHELVSKRA